ncbi:MAG TPA: response regulator transcription factor [Iamia sp.]|nr:response regulator transcription factor [Iamia sp.]
MATLVAPPPSRIDVRIVVSGPIGSWPIGPQADGFPAAPAHPVHPSLPRLLVVEPDADLRAAYASALAADGHDVHAVATVAAARAARPATFDCVVLDRVGGGDDLVLVDEIYRTGGRTRVVVVSGQASDADRVEGLTRGADDYLAQPVGLPELVARVRRLTRCRVTSSAPPIRLGRVVIDQDRRVAHLDGGEVDLTPTQYELLVTLAREPGCIVHSRLLLERGWHDHRDLDSAVLRPHVARLRKALRGSIEVRCVRGVGYVLEVVGATVAAGRARVADEVGRMELRTPARAKTA